jgi:hypothetical protein
VTGNCHVTMTGCVSRGTRIGNNNGVKVGAFGWFAKTKPKDAELLMAAMVVCQAA